MKDKNIYNSFPEISKELIEKLNEIYPEECPNPNHSIPEMFMKAGARDVVRRLNLHYERQLQKYR